MQPTPASRLEAVRERLDRACQKAGRRPEDVQLLAVSKTRSDDEILALYHLGQRAFGENRVTEASGKQSRLPADIQWHMIGHLQSNKAKECAGFSTLHSLDREPTARALEKMLVQRNQTLDVLLEVNTGEESKEGVRGGEELRALVRALESCPHLRIRGLMTMAPFSPEESVVRPCFVRLRAVRDELQAEFPRQDWSALSMGMTNDFEWAIEEGSTVVRIGTALFEGFR